MLSGGVNITDAYILCYTMLINQQVLPGNGPLGELALRVKFSMSIRHFTLQLQGKMPTKHEKVHILLSDMGEITSG